MYKCNDCNHVSDSLVSLPVDPSLNLKTKTVDVCEKCESEDVIDLDYIEYDTEAKSVDKYEGMTMEEFRGER
jgi:hypothetical protein